MYSTSKNNLYKVLYDSQTIELALPAETTVEDLKYELFLKTGVHPTHQIINDLPGDKQDNGKTIDLVFPNERVLWLSSAYEDDKAIHKQTESTNVQSAISKLASASFISKLVCTHGNNYVTTLKDCSLSEALENLGSASTFGKHLVLYLHNDEDVFSSFFCPMLISGEIRNILERAYHVIAWDLTNIADGALEDVLDQWVELDLVKSWIAQKRASLFIISSIENTLAILTIISENNMENLKLTLQEIEKMFQENMEETSENNSIGTAQTLQESENIFQENMEETSENNSIGSAQTLQESENIFQEKMEETSENNSVGSSQVSQEIQNMFQENRGETLGNNSIGSQEFHQIMFNRLGDRDYDSFEVGEYDYLKQKIGYAKFGPPPAENYNKKQQKDIERTFDAIIKHGAAVNGLVVVSFIYNCLEPLPIEKFKRRKKYSDYDPHSDIMPLPIFVIPKCGNSSNPCRIFIDHDLRVYTSWENYIEKNKLHKCLMVLPNNGRYDGDENGNVKLEKHMSPSCSIEHAVLQGTDVAVSTVGITSGAVFLAAAIPAITVAPIALTVASITGVGVGLYGIIRSAININDRVVHDQTMSFANSEARGAYLNIVAGSLGFVGAGTTTLVSKLVSRGVNIGQGAKLAINAVNVVNIGCGAASIVNTSYEMFDTLLEGGKVSSLAVIQLSSSILFFGNAVYSFKTANTIIDEAQVSALRKYQDSLTSNRLRKMLNKLTKETIRQNGNVQSGRAEVISTISKFPNTTEALRILLRYNKVFNKEGVRFAAQNGKITLNGRPVNLNEMVGMSAVETRQFLRNLPSIPATPSPKEVQTINDIFESILKSHSAKLLRYGRAFGEGSFKKLAAVILQDFTAYLKQQILKIFVSLLEELNILNINIVNICKEYIPNIHPYLVTLKYVVQFIKIKVEYNMRSEKDKELLETLKSRKKKLIWFEKFLNFFVDDGCINRGLLGELVDFVVGQVTEALAFHFYNEDRAKNRLTQSMNTSQRCYVCGGFPYR